MLCIPARRKTGARTRFFHLVIDRKIPCFNYHQSVVLVARDGTFEFGLMAGFAIEARGSGCVGVYEGSEETSLLTAVDVEETHKKKKKQKQKKKNGDLYSALTKNQHNALYNSYVQIQTLIKRDSIRLATKHYNYNNNQIHASKQLSHHKHRNTYSKPGTNTIIIVSEHARARTHTHT